MFQRVIFWSNQHTVLTFKPMKFTLQPLKRRYKTCRLSFRNTVDFLKFLFFGHSENSFVSIFLMKIFVKLLTTCEMTLEAPLALKCCTTEGRIRFWLSIPVYFPISLPTPNEQSNCIDSHCEKDRRKEEERKKRRKGGRGNKQRQRTE